MEKYKIITEKRKELEQGRKTVYLAEKIGISRTYLSYILNGGLNIKEDLAQRIVNVCLDSKSVSFKKFFTKV